MHLHLKKPTLIKSAGNKPKLIEEFIGVVNSNSTDISIARMKSPAGWIEPSQTPDFDEYTFVLKGTVVVKTGKEEFIVKENEIFLAQKGNKVQYSTPNGAEYMAVCLPAFTPQSVHRDEQNA